MARYVLLAIPYALQLLCIVHIMRNGRETYWIWIVLFLPYVGGLAYLIVEILPALGSRRRVEAARAAVTKVLAPGRELRDLRNKADFSPTVENRTQLADALAGAGDWPAALSEYEACLAGQVRVNPALLYKAAAAAFEAGDTDRASGYLDRLGRNGKGVFEQKAWNALHLRIAERTRAPEEASAEYERIRAVLDDRDIDCQYLEHLERTGDFARMDALLERIRAEEASLRGMGVRYDRDAYRRAYAVGRRAKRPTG